MSVQSNSPRGLSNDYAPTRRPGGRGALIASVVEGGPAQRAGLRPGMTLTTAEGEGLRDLIDWYWLADGEEVEVEGTAARDLLDDDAGEFSDQEGDVVEFSCLIEREPGEPWGLEFSDAVFDQVRTCVNACTFCFMTMLPDGMRPALYLRDDDYRLSFLQGNFVTLTNMSDDDVERVVECGLSPLHVSVHAISPGVRRRLLGANAPRGIEVLEQLLDAGIEVHAQLVVCPGENDGEELDRTLLWLEERSGVLSVGIVPLGFTRYQDRFSESFNDPDKALAVIRQVEPFQARARRAHGRTRFHLADEWYLDAHVAPPAADCYDGFPQYEDGIGMLRSFIDGWDGAADDIARIAAGLAALPEADRPVIATGEAFGRWFAPRVAASPLAGLVDLLPVKNEWFGGNVDVAGLLTAHDVVASLSAHGHGRPLVPGVMFNDDGLTLDGCDLAGMSAQVGREVRMVSCTAEGLIEALCEAAGL